MSSAKRARSSSRVSITTLRWGFLPVDTDQLDEPEGSLPHDRLVSSIEEHRPHRAQGVQCPLGEGGVGGEVAGGSRRKQGRKPASILYRESMVGASVHTGECRASWQATILP